MDTLGHITEVGIYLAAITFGVFALVETSSLGLTAFAASAFISCFLGGCWSLYIMLTRSTP